MAKYDVMMSATNVYRLTIEAASREEAEEKALNMWQNESFDWNSVLYDTIDLMVDDVEEMD